MKIFLLGATGNSGRRIMTLALRRNHEVTAFVRDEGKLLSLVETPIPPNLHVSVGGISKPADIAMVMAGHDVAINAAGQVTDGPAFTQLVRTVIDSAVASLGEGGRFWLFGGAAILDVPGAHMMGVDLPKVPKVYEAHRANFNAVREKPIGLVNAVARPDDRWRADNGFTSVGRRMACGATRLYLRSAQIGLGVCFQAKTARVDDLIRGRGQSDPRQSFQKWAVLPPTRRGRASAWAAQKLQ